MFKQLIAIFKSKKNRTSPNNGNTTKFYELKIEELKSENLELMKENERIKNKLKAKNKKIKILELQNSDLSKQLQSKEERKEAEPVTILQGSISNNNIENKEFVKRTINYQEKKVKNAVKTNFSKIEKVNYSLRKLAFITKLSENDPMSELNHELILLAVYSDPFLKNQSGYIEMRVLADQNSGKAYLSEKEISSFKKKIGSKYFDIRDKSKDVSVIKKMDLNSSNFNWPSTDLKGGYYDEEKSVFKEESELKKLGYQITGMTREKRWKVLETAVKQLGLKKVAYTIAQNVKLRKGQKDGTKKFSYAINEWEYDLNKLKNTYYKNEFSWPSTRA